MKFRRAKYGLVPGRERLPGADEQVVVADTDGGQEISGHLSSQFRLCINQKPQWRTAQLYRYPKGMKTTNRIKYIFLASVLSTLVVACGTVSVATKPNQKISRTAKITVVSPSNDPQNVAGQLEHLLLAQGFGVTSEIVGRTELEYREAEASEPGSRMTAGSVGQVRRLPTNLVLRFSYNAYYDVFYWSFTRFNGTVVVLESGAVVASVSFSGDRSVNSVLSDFANQLGRMAE